MGLDWRLILFLVYFVNQCINPGSTEEISSDEPKTIKTRSIPNLPFLPFLNQLSPVQTLSPYRQVTFSNVASLSSNTPGNLPAILPANIGNLPSTNIRNFPGFSSGDIANLPGLSSFSSFNTLSSSIGKRSSPNFVTSVDTSNAPSIPNLPFNLSFGSLNQDGNQNVIFQNNQGINQATQNPFNQVTLQGPPNVANQVIQNQQHNGFNGLNQLTLSPPNGINQVAQNPQFSGFNQVMQQPSGLSPANPFQNQGIMFGAQNQGFSSSSQAPGLPNIDISQNNQRQQIPGPSQSIQLPGLSFTQTPSGLSLQNPIPDEDSEVTITQNVPQNQIIQPNVFLGPNQQLDNQIRINNQFVNQQRPQFQPKPEPQNNLITLNDVQQPQAIPNQLSQNQNTQPNVFLGPNQQLDNQIRVNNQFVNQQRPLFEPKLEPQNNLINLNNVQQPQAIQNQPFQYNPQPNPNQINSQFNQQPMQPTPQLQIIQQQPQLISQPQINQQLQPPPQLQVIQQQAQTISQPQFNQQPPQLQFIPQQQIPQPLLNQDIQDNINTQTFVNQQNQQNLPQIQIAQQQIQTQMQPIPSLVNQDFQNYRNQLQVKPQPTPQVQFIQQPSSVQQPLLPQLQVQPQTNFNQEAQQINVIPQNLQNQPQYLPQIQIQQPNFPQIQVQQPYSNQDNQVNIQTPNVINQQQQNYVPQTQVFQQPQPIPQQIQNNQQDISQATQVNVNTQNSINQAPPSPPISLNSQPQQIPSPLPQLQSPNFNFEPHFINSQVQLSPQNINNLNMASQRPLPQLQVNQQPNVNQETQINVNTQNVANQQPLPQPGLINQQQNINQETQVSANTQNVLNQQPSQMPLPVQLNQAQSNQQISTNQETQITVNTQNAINQPQLQPIPTFNQDVSQNFLNQQLSQIISHQPTFINQLTPNNINQVPQILITPQNSPQPIQPYTDSQSSITTSSDISVQSIPQTSYNFAPIQSVNSFQSNQVPQIQPEYIEPFYDSYSTFQPEQYTSVVPLSSYISSPSSLPTPSLSPQYIPTPLVVPDRKKNGSFGDIIQLLLLSQLLDCGIENNPLLALLYAYL